MHPREIDREIPKYEGLVFTTATMIVGKVDLDLDEIQQRLRVTVWKALRSYRRELSPGPRATDEKVRSFVFSCVVNQKKDILKSQQTVAARGRRGQVYIEDHRHADGEHDDGFEEAYLSVSAEEVFGAIDDHLALPNTLDHVERQVVILLYAGRSKLEIRRVLDLSVAAIDERISSVQAKLGDWRPPSPPPERPPSRVAPPPPMAAPAPVRRRRPTAERAATGRRRAAA